MKPMPRSKHADPDAERFGAIMFRERAALGWTLEDLGRFSGMTADFLGLVERGLNVPSLRTILRIAEALEIPAGKLIDEVEAERPRMRPRRSV